MSWAVKTQNRCQIAMSLNMICSTGRSYMRISGRSRTDFDEAKIQLTGHFDRRLTVIILSP